MSQENLKHRLNRIIGQLEGLKRRMNSDDDCIKTLNQLKASINGLKKFAEAYMNSHMDECLTKGLDSKDIKDSLKQVIKGAFSL